MPDAIIIGAGVAGISAATTLGAAGWHVRILDKAGRPGGRCATRHVSAEPARLWFDYGAQYFTARDPAFRGVVEHDLGTGHLQRWQADIHVAERQATGWQLTTSPDHRERLIAPAGLNHWVRHRLRACHAKLRCKTRATAVTHATGRWQVALDNDQPPLHADAVIVTIPATQAAALLGEVATTIPALADADRALQACHSLVVRAPALPACHGVFVQDGKLSWIGDNSHKAGRDDAACHLWTLHATPEFSHAHIDAAPDTVQCMLMHEFAAISGIAIHRIEPVHAHRWRYARPGAGAPDAGLRCFVDSRGRFVLAGDWLAGGRVEGAWLSGRAAARWLTRA